MIERAARHGVDSDAGRATGAIDIPILIVMIYSIGWFKCMSISIEINRVGDFQI